VTANTRTRTMIAAPTAPSGRCRTKSETAESQVARGASALASSSRVCGAAAMLAVADARIDPPVGDIDHEIDGQERGRDQHHQRLDQRVIAMRDSLDEQHAQPVQVEHLL